jgi:molybdenum cofactor cytidylyltransferase
MSDSAVAAVLLAAGESRRMGAPNKLTLPVQGQPLLRRTARTLLDSGLDEIVVVLGHESDRARELLRDLPLKLVENPHYRDGQMTSVHCGLAALERTAKGVMICLADQPRLQAADINYLIERYRQDCTRPLLVPVFEGRRGNPIILSYAQRAAILAGDRNLGCRRLIERQPELVWPCVVHSDHYIEDIDTPQDYERLAGGGRMEQQVAGVADR